MAATARRYAQYAAHTKCPVAHAVAHALGPDYRDDAVFDWDFASPDGLSMRDAWAMATRWNARLRGHVSVSVDERRAAFSVLETYEWVDVWLGCGSREEAAETARAAREATLVWRTLEKCQGFGASENAVFWKLLFSELQKPKEGESACLHVFESQYVTDTVAFFKDVAFPRVRLHFSDDLDAEDVESVVKVFAVEGDMSAELEKFATRHAVRLTDPIEVTLRLNLQKTLDRIKRLIEIVDAQHQEEDCSTGTGALRVPKFVVTTLDPVDVASIGEYQEFERMLDLPVAVSTDCLGHQEDPYKFRQYLEWALRLDGAGCGGLHQLELALDDSSPNPIAAVCSALPLTRSLQTLSISGIAGSLYEITDADAAWLSYALFHPDSAMSSWQKLHLKQLISTDQNKLSKMLSIMACGNNLRAALGLDDDENVVEAYFSARIRPGAVVRDQAHDEARIFNTIEASTWMEVCVSSTEVSSVDEWVPVIAPGYGMAWVRSSAVEEIVSRPPGEPFMTRLTFSTCNIAGPQVANMIQLTGSQLEFVDLTGLSQAVITNHALPTICTSCRQLRSLRVSLFSDEELNMYPLPPQLRHLRVSFRTDGETLYYEDSTVEELHELESLVLEANEAPWEEIVSNFVLPLLHSSPRLQYFGWTSGLANSDLRRDLSYLQRRSVSQETFKLVDREQDGVAIIGEKAPMPTLLALLSVIERKRDAGDSAIGTLDPILVDQVTRFVGTTANRELVVDGAWFMIYNSRTE